MPCRPLARLASLALSLGLPTACLAGALGGALVGAPAGAQEIFSDAFESGDLVAWDSVSGAVPCGRGLALSGALEGDLGPAPAGPYEQLACLEYRNDLVGERLEVAWGGIPLPERFDVRTVDELTLVGPGDRRIAAQFRAISRWGGRVDDASRPIRWLQVTAPVRVAGEDITTLSLRRVPGLAPASDPFAVTSTPVGAFFEIDTGLATATIDPAKPALLDTLAADPDDDGVGRSTILSPATGGGAGLRWVFDAAGTDVVIGTATGDPNTVVVDPGSFELLEAGPVRSVVMVRGHFVDGAGRSLCSTLGGSVVYERFGFTLALSFERASRDVGIEFVLRNECSDAQTGPWTDEGVTLRSASLRYPLDLAGSPAFVFAGSGAASAHAATTVRVAQERGDTDGGSWTRSARVTANGAPIETAETFAEPFVGISGDDFRASVHLGWMRHREPQALVGSLSQASVQELAIEGVGDTLEVGEGKGIWNVARLAIEPSAGQAGGSTIDGFESTRSRVTALLERPLLPRASRAVVDASGIFPSIGQNLPSTLRTRYVEWMDAMHQELVGPNGGIERGRRWGSQLWPESGANDPFGVDAATPNDSLSAMNYWDPAGAEMLEFLRTGDPRWVWDFALPAYWTQAHAAYLNVGHQTHGTRDGVAVTSGGPGCDQNGPPNCTADGTAGGQWHRSAFGSDDYTYAMSMELAQALRPSPALRDRFAHAGSMIARRYSIPRAQEDQRECFFNEVDVTRQVIQHFEMLANCAEFVDGAIGQTCHDKLAEVVDELAQDNLNAGLLCQRFESTCYGTPAPPATLCSTPQQFMQNSLMIAFFHRMWRNYGDPPNGSIREMLVGTARTLDQYAVPKRPDGSIDTGFGQACDPSDGSGCWWPRMECQLSADQSQVLSCAAAPDSDGNLFMGPHTRPHTLAMLLLGHEIDPSLDLCAPIRDAYEVDAFTGAVGDPQGGWQNVGHFVPIGWWKGTSQMMQGMVFGLGIRDTCEAAP